MNASIIIKARSLLRQGSFGKNLGLLAGGTTIAQIVTFMSSPVLTRLYSPRDFGVYSLYSSIFGVLIVVVSLRYEVAIPLPEEEEKSLRLLGLALLTVISVSMVIGLIVCCVSPRVPWKTTGGMAFLWMLPFNLLGAGTYQVLNYWAIRTKSFRSIAKTKVTQGLTLSVGQVVLGFLQLGPMGLIVGQLVGQTTGTLALMGLLKNHARKLIAVMAPQSILQVAREYVNYPLYVTWSALFNILSTQLPVFILSTAFGSFVVGWYALSMRVIQTPMTLIGQFISQLFYSQMTEDARNGKLKVSVEKIAERLIICGVSPIAMLAVAAPVLFRILFGQEWEEAGIYCRFLSPWLLVVFVSSPLSNLVFLLRRQKQELLFQTVLLIARVSTLLIGRYIGNSNWTVIAFSFVSSAVWLGYLLWLLKISGVQPMRTLKILFLEFCKVAPILFPIVLLVVFKASVYLTIWTLFGSTIVAGFHVYKTVKKVN